MLFSESAIVKCPRLGLHLRDEHRLEHEIAEFLTQCVVVVAVDRLEHLVGFLEHKRLQRIDGLFAVPRAAVWTAKPGHDFDEPHEFGGTARGIGHLIILVECPNHTNRR